MSRKNADSTAVKRVQTNEVEPSRSSKSSATKLAARRTPTKKATARTPRTREGAERSAHAKTPKAVVFSVGEQVVYPVHGVGKIVSIEEQYYNGHLLELLNISFVKERMIVRIPRERVAQTGLRHPINSEILEDVFAVLKSQKRVRRGMWSRKAQDFETKINSGDPILVAEVVRDLHRTEAMQDPSFSEQQLYRDAVERLAGEVAAVKEISTDQATELIEGVLTAVN